MVGLVWLRVGIHVLYSSLSNHSPFLGSITQGSNGSAVASGSTGGSTAGGAGVRDKYSIDCVVAKNNVGVSSITATGNCALTNGAQSSLEGFISGSAFGGLSVEIQGAMRAAAAGGVSSSISGPSEASFSAYLNSPS